jgi:hypothetical protein
LVSVCCCIWWHFCTAWLKLRWRQDMEAALVSFKVVLACEWSSGQNNWKNCEDSLFVYWASKQVLFNTKQEC